MITEGVGNQKSGEDRNCWLPAHSDYWMRLQPATSGHIGACLEGQCEHHFPGELSDQALQPAIQDRNSRLLVFMKWNQALHQSLDLLQAAPWGTRDVDTAQTWVSEKGDESRKHRR